MTRKHTKPQNPKHSNHTENWVTTAADRWADPTADPGRALACTILHKTTPVWL